MTDEQIEKIVAAIESFIDKKILEHRDNERALNSDDSRCGWVTTHYEREELVNAIKEVVNNGKN